MILLVNCLLNKKYWNHELKKYNENSSKFKLFFLFIFLILVHGIADNKYEEEEVNEHDARIFAHDIKGVFRLTSVNDNTGINDLFYSLGNNI